MRNRIVGVAIVTLAMAGCADRGIIVPPPRSEPAYLSLAGPLTTSEEELIGREVVGGEVGGYRVLLTNGRSINDTMYYLPGGTTHSHIKWGWFIDQGGDCEGSTPEQHDIDGDGQADTTELESHCIPNGEYTVTLADGSGVLFQRRIAMLNGAGAPKSGAGFHDVHVWFDVTAPNGDTLAGDIRVGDTFRTMQDSSDLYPSATADTIAAGDTLWLISTYVAQGTDGRPWYSSTLGILAQFSPNHVDDPSFFTGAVNSVPYGATPSFPYQWRFASEATRDFYVRGRIVRPYDVADTAGTTPNESLRVHVVAPVSCFTHSDTLRALTPVTFNSSCSSVYPNTIANTSTYWQFGDGSTHGWATAESTVTHTYSTAGTDTVRLQVRRAGSTTPVAVSSQVLVIAPADTLDLTAGIDGPDIINESGYYTWNSLITDGVAPFGYRWYYRYLQSGTDTLVGTDSSYSRWVSVDDPFVFRLRLYLSDASPDTSMAQLFVDVWDPGQGEAAQRVLGAFDSEGTCRELPPRGPLRQALYEAIVAAGRWPRLCYVSTTR